ncbi:RNA polymerase II elongation factor ELL3 [Alligator sinensis]|uniref:RNA polymerase II elongation factor ELL3 n=1 Tax=Alligator sinensis TaxID=38654 RepID=A0A3Q0H873_ALLSI|nr:RNA polymerase II elongation factor ELL3 [Alligator sinensis]
MPAPPQHCALLGAGKAAPQRWTPRHWPGTWCSSWRHGPNTSMSSWHGWRGHGAACRMGRSCWQCWSRQVGAHWGGGSAPGAARLTLLPGLQVAQPEPGGHRYCLREELLGQVQEDWPGYTPAERQLLAQLLHRKQELGAWAGPSLAPRQEGAETPAQQNTGKKPWGMKRLALPASCRPPQLKRARVAEASLESCPGSLQEPRPEPARAQPQPEQPSRPSTPGETLSSEEAGEDWEEGTPCLEQDLAVLGDGGLRAGSPAAFAEIPDYCRKFGAIRSAEQCRAYTEAFSADYAEYRYLHARIGNVSRHFGQLGARIKTLQRGTAEHKVSEGQLGGDVTAPSTAERPLLPVLQAAEDRVVQEYRRFKRTYPGYRKEKDRCEYLHRKLSHIKGLILQFEEGHSP